MKDKLMLTAIRARNEITGLGRRLEKGQSTTEFGLLIAGVVIVVLVVIAIFSGALEKLWTKVADLITGG